MTFLSGTRTSTPLSAVFCTQRDRIRIQHRSSVVQALFIDRRHHLELAWERMERQAELLAPENLHLALSKCDVISVKNLTHLEALLEHAGGQLVCLSLYSASCGVCSELRRSIRSICTDLRHQRARTIFLEHDIYDEFDFPSDVARYYRVKSSPKLLIFVDGALLKTLSILDVRVAAAKISPLITEQEQRLRAVLFEQMVKHAPGSRK